MEYTREIILYKLGDHLLSRRKGFDKLSLQKLSEISGVSRNNISLIENGKIEPGIITMRKLSHSLGFNMSEFFNFSMRSEKFNILDIDDRF